MHPAPSIILFTTFSGAGFGLFFWLGLGWPAPVHWAAFGPHLLAGALAGGGLVASVFHLRHPERALRALSQWRSSWLSREGLAALAALLVMALHGAAAVFAGVRIVPLGVIGAALALLTVLTTAMIYAQLRTVPRWHHWSTPALFLALALAGGAILAGQGRAALPFLGLAAALQLLWWRGGDRRLAGAGHDLASATGLRGGRVRLFAPPHTGGNYLLREMVHVVGRKHAARLRAIALGLGYGLPALLLVAAPGAAGTVLAALGHLGGILASRWLFFAEAEHVVGLYYGREPGAPLR
ncbi:MAG: dimethyl sulfoxide reductase anchor subunit [Rubellimicrobium sp.]|nr:dimethyl sulfoxide reductase anchor subunit [Rubellimicrobium sp.]